MTTTANVRAKRLTVTFGELWRQGLFMYPCQDNAPGIALPHYDHEQLTAVTSFHRV